MDFSENMGLKFIKPNLFVCMLLLFIHIIEVERAVSGGTVKIWLMLFEVYL